MAISDAVVGNLTTLYLLVIAAMKVYGMAAGQSFSSGYVIVLSTVIVAAILIASLTWDVSRKATHALITRDHAHEMCRGGICWHGVAVKLVTNSSVWCHLTLNSKLVDDKFHVCHEIIRQLQQVLD